jgi:hypothetical protein
MGHDAMTSDASPTNDSRRRVLGALLGGGFGLLLAWWLRGQGWTLPALPGAALALGAGLAARRSSLAFGLVWAVAAVALTLLTHWWFFPYRHDGSFGFFVQHLDALPLRTLLTLAAVAAVGVWFGRGRNPRRRPTPVPA